MGEFKRKEKVPTSTGKVFEQTLIRTHKLHRALEKTLKLGREVLVKFNNKKERER